MSRRRKRGQSTLEYVVLMTGLVLAFIAILQPGGIFQQSYTRTLTSLTGQVENMAARLNASRPLSP